MKIGVIIAACDGVNSLVTGVGVIINSVIESFHKIKKESKFLSSNDIELICVTPYLNPKSLDFNKQIKNITIESCLKNNGKLVEIPTFSDGSRHSVNWGGSMQWKSASLSVASFLSTIEGYDLIIFLGNDTIFALVGNYLKEYKNLTIIWIPHSLGRIFNDEFSNNERLSIEKNSISLINKANNCYVGYIGDYYKEVLLKEYSCKKEKLIPFKNGIYIDSSRFTISDKDKRGILDKYNIPGDKKIIFSWGRCVYQKGFDKIIPAFRKFFEDYPKYHLVLLMPIETSNEDYLMKIKEEISLAKSGSVTAIFEFNWLLPKAILDINQLEVVIFASRFEGFPITALEAVFFSKNIKYIYTKIPQLVSLFENNDFAYAIEDVENFPSLYNSLKEAVLDKKSNQYGITSIPDIIKHYAEGFDSIFVKND